ncbi:MFS transporter [Halocatena salina]|uniref:MFS transporter n=1 Tax=Halocatena salina TaxID=2934340 RepID=A0A8U0A111_9EURY|nr:MFS transporter [Halocatena salina]UPM42752.1 MFS transporter [Halocatena salina]
MSFRTYLPDSVVDLFDGQNDAERSTEQASDSRQSVPSRSGDGHPRRARLADSIVFGILGAVFATWAVRIPAVSGSLALSEGDIGIALLGLAFGSIIGLLTSGVIVTHYGGRNVIRVGLGVYSLALVGITVTDGLATLVGVALVFGFGKGVTDVAANAQGVRIERAYPGQIMGSFHALFSGGGLVGAGFGAVATSVGLSVRMHFTLVGVVLLVTGLVASVWLLPKAPDAGTGRTVVLPSRTLIGFCVIGFCALFIEGVGNDWSAVYLETSAGGTATVGALGFAAFSGTMMLGRFLADHAVERANPKRFLRFTAVVAAIGIALTLVARPLITVVGFGVLGLGLAGMMPVALSLAASHDSGLPTEQAIAAVSTAGYGGFAVGPVVIGAIAEATSLRVAFVPALGLTVLLVGVTGLLPTVVRSVSEGETPA